MPAGPAPTAFDPGPWNRLLAETARRHQVPGIVAGVLSIDPATGAERRMVASAGITNNQTFVESDPDTVCQVGSITKVVTATMIMQLREEGRLDLETPIVDLLPDLVLDSEHTEAITVWNLLTHTSGIDGDLFTDTGRGDECVERYVAELKSAQSLFAPKAGWSYCNSGFVLLGRIIEVLDERVWDASLQARIIEPLGLTKFLTFPEHVLRYRFQYGHVRPPGGEVWTPAPTGTITRSMGPAGLVTSSADDLLSFGAAFLRGGQMPDGGRLLSEESVAEMMKLQWELDPAANAMAPQWGLGWMRDTWTDGEGQGHRVVWHGGTTIGNNAWFQVLPDDNVAFVVFCNGGVAPHAAAEVYGAFAEEFAGVTPTTAAAPSGPAGEAAVDEAWLGRYGDASTTVTVSRTEGGEIEALLENRLDLGTKPDGVTVTLHPTDQPKQFVCRPDTLSPWAPLSFTEIDGVPTAYLGIRALPRQSAESEEVSA